MFVRKGTVELLRFVSQRNIFHFEYYKEVFLRPYYRSFKVLDGATVEFVNPQNEIRTLQILTSRLPYV
jgi:hypothetical protein